MSDRDAILTGAAARFADWGRKLRDAAPWGLAVLFGLAGLAFRVNLLALDRSLWFDAAALAVNVVECPLAALFGPLPYMSQLAPPGFLVLSKLMAAGFGYREAALRMLPAIFGILSLPLMAVLSFRILPRAAAFLPVGFLALSTTAIYYTAEFKQYSGDLFFALCIAVLCLRVNVGGARAPRALAVFAAVSAAAVWFSHVAVLTAAAAGAMLCASALTRRPFDRRWVLRVGAGCAVVAVSALAAYLLAFRPAMADAMPGLHAEGFVPLPWREGGTLGWHRAVAAGLLEFPLGFAYPLGLSQLCGILWLAIAAGAVAVGRRDWRHGVLTLGPLALLYALALLRAYPIEAGAYEINSRLILFAAPFLYLLAAAGLHALVGERFRLLYAGLACLLLVGQFRKAAGADYLREETRPLIERIAADRRPGDWVLVDPGAEPAFRYYNRNFALPHKDMPPGASGPAVLPPDADPSGRIWFLYAHSLPEDVRRRMAALDAVADRVSEQTAPGAGLVLYRRAAAGARPGDRL